MNDAPELTGISAITLYTADMARALTFYVALGFEVVYGGASSTFTSFRAGAGFVNLVKGTPPATAWGRVIIYVGDVDAMHRRALDAGFATLTTPRDAEWGERYFHILDPDNNELSFARPLSQ
jgi:catechol 2,3-dioxygenase-like lactoylglutathione lyase family enzyme